MKYSKGSFPFKMTFEDQYGPRKTLRDVYGDQMDQKQSYYENQRAEKQSEWERTKREGNMDHNLTLGKESSEDQVRDLKKDKRMFQWDKFKSFFGGGKDKRQNIQKDIDWTKTLINKRKNNG